MKITETMGKDRFGATHWKRCIAMTMVINNCIFADNTVSPDIIAIVLTVMLAGIYFGSRKVMKKGISPIVLFLISAVCGIFVYGM